MASNCFGTRDASVWAEVPAAKPEGVETPDHIAQWQSIQTRVCCHLRLLPMVSAHPCSFQPQASFCLWPWELHLTSRKLTQPAREAAKACWIERSKSKIWQWRTEAIVFTSQSPTLQQSRFKQPPTQLRCHQPYGPSCPQQSSDPRHRRIFFSNLPSSQSFLRISFQINQPALSGSVPVLLTVMKSMCRYQNLLLMTSILFSTKWVGGMPWAVLKLMNLYVASIFFLNLFLAILRIEPRSWQTRTLAIS